jgi:hypothetical protein
MIIRARLLFPLLTAAMLVATSCSTTSGPAAGTTRRTYDVRDLVLPATGAAWIALPDLTANLKEATDPELWNRKGFQVKGEETGYLIVDASEGAHLMVARFLSDIRHFASTSRPASSDK